MATIKEILNQESISKKKIRNALQDEVPIGRHWDKSDFDQLHRWFQMQAQKDYKCGLTNSIMSYFCENVS